MSSYFRKFEVIVVILIIVTVVSLVTSMRPLEVKEIATCDGSVTHHRYYKSQNSEPAYRQAVLDRLGYTSTINCTAGGKAIFELYR